ncbi:MAG: large subunit ribosomal protein [Frankiales bacterium]|jgi:large subunit ribosomal protein L18|nr:large subunit ribosomal protein [Frankiales bacterium]
MSGVAEKRRVARLRRHRRVRKRVDGTSARPRLVVTRSLRQIYAQVVDDSASRTIASASSLDASLRGTSGDKSTHARAVGELVAQRAKEAGVGAVVFDRAGNKYGGRIAALADGARAGGLEF